MRMNIALIALSMLILTAGIVCVYAMHRNLDALNEEAMYALDSLPDDAEGALAALDRFATRWERLKKLWQLFAIHEDLDNVTRALTEAQNALSAHDMQQATNACDALLLALEVIHEKEVPSMGNIF